MNGKKRKYNNLPVAVPTVCVKNRSIPNDPTFLAWPKRNLWIYYNLCIKNPFLTIKHQRYCHPHNNEQNCNISNSRCFEQIQHWITFVCLFVLSHCPATILKSVIHTLIHLLPIHFGNMFHYFDRSVNLTLWDKPTSWLWHNIRCENSEKQWSWSNNSKLPPIQQI